MKSAIPCFIFLLAISIIGCKGKKSKPQNVKNADTSLRDPSIKGNFSEQTTLHLDSNYITAFLDSFPDLKPSRNELLTFYRNRSFAFAWSDQDGLIEQAANLYNRVQNIVDEGVDEKKLLYQPAFNKLMENKAAAGSDSLNAFTELMLTSQYLMYAKNVWEGVDEKESIAMEWLLPRKKISYTQLLDSLISGKDVLENAPVYRQYYLLKDYLKKYKALENTDTAKISSTQKLFKAGDSSAVIKQIRHRLFLYQDLTEDNGSAKFDATLLSAIKSFQQRVGLTVNGNISMSLINELNVPVRQRIEQILVNMERSRWVPDNQLSDYLVINIPEYKMHVYENDTLAWDMNVVVGKDQHRTVIFNGDMKYIVFSPYWNIPASILKNETLPAIKRNPNYLASHNMEWNGGNVRQKPGPNNSLGLVKFLFPNSHAIYLHDSPAKSLFNETNRAFSHGCIRLSEPKKLAVYLLRKDSTWNEEKIAAAMNSRKEQYVTLKKTVPVFIAYFTAWVAQDGKLNFRNDIYKRDTRLSEMILKTPRG